MQNGAFATDTSRSDTQSAEFKIPRDLDSIPRDLLVLEIMNLRSRLTRLTARAAEQAEQISRLKEANSCAMNALYNKSSERNSNLPKNPSSQLCLTLDPIPDEPEAEHECDDEAPADNEGAQTKPPETEGEAPQKKRRKSNPRKKNRGLSLSEFANSVEPREVIYYDEHGRVIAKLDDSDTDIEPIACPNCSGEMHVLGYTRTREVVTIPSIVYVREHRTPNMGCRSCEANSISVPVVQTPRTLARPLPRRLPSAETLAWLIFEKVFLAMPLYRLCRFFEEIGIPMNRATLANWLIEVAERYLIPLAECLRRELLSQKIIHADETPFQVLHEDGRSADQKSYMWIYCSTYGVDDRYVVLDYHPSRASDCPEKFLGDFHGIIHCDGYSGYKTLETKNPCISLSGCWAHVRRKWYKAALHDASDSVARAGYTFVQKLFQLEAQFADIEPKPRFWIRLKQVMPLLEKFHAWLETQYAGKDLVGKAITYTINQWPSLMNYLADGRTQATNAAAELIAKDFAIGRKNYLFSDSVRGARALAAAYSVVESARANDIPIFSYLTWVLSNAAPDMADIDNAWSQSDDAQDTLLKARIQCMEVYLPRNFPRNWSPPALKAILPQIHV